MFPGAPEAAHVRVFTGRMPSAQENVHRPRASPGQDYHAKKRRAFAERVFGTAFLNGGSSTVNGGSGGNGPRLGAGFVVERGRDVADADDADQAVVIDHRQVPNMVFVHQMTGVFKRIG